MPVLVHGGVRTNPWVLLLPKNPLNARLLSRALPRVVQVCLSRPCSFARFDRAAPVSSSTTRWTWRGTRDATRLIMFNESRAFATHASIPNRFDREQQQALACLCRQTRTLRTANFLPVPFDLDAKVGGFSPRAAFLLDDGRALAWFGERRPYIVHPSFADLCAMHGLRGALARAA